MIKKILFLVSLFILSVMVVFAETTVKFMDSSYSLKWSNKNSADGFTNEYLKPSDTIDTYRTKVTVSEFIKVKDHVETAKSMYSVFSKDVNAGKAVMANIDKIDDKSIFVAYCAIVKNPKPNFECDYYNVQAKPSSVMVYQFTKRYFLNEVKLTEKNVEQFIKDEMAKIKPNMVKVSIPQIINKEIEAK